MQRKTGKRAARTPDNKSSEAPAAAPKWAAQMSSRSRKTSEVIALEIVRSIVRQKLKAGDRLPGEAQMLQQYGVSRPSLREALRLLEVQGLLGIRPGPGGGPVVGVMNPRTLAHTMTLYLHLSECTYKELAAAYAMAEPQLAELAAQNPDRERVRKAMTPYLAGSDKCHAQMRDVSAGVAFHDVVADLAGNHVLHLALSAVSFIFTEHIYSAAPTLTTLNDRDLDEHKAIAAAIIDGKADRARRLMAKHVDNTIAAFEAAWPLKVGEKIRW